MNDFQQQFDNLYTGLQQTKMFADMERTVEGSPWHREANVAVHTQMVVDEYRRLVNQRKNALPWSESDMIGAVACAFHDVGKPAAEVKKWSQERGEYRAYGGHEIISARKAEDYLIKHNLLNPVDVSAVVWMIEHHMPWNIEDREKVAQIATTASMYDFTTYTTALLADQYGRIADDQPAKNKRAEAWVDSLRQVPHCTLKQSEKVAWMPIGVSGSGKSTFFRDLQDRYSAVDVFSLDILRHQFYDATDYGKAFDMSTKDSSFEARAQAKFFEMLRKEPQYVYMDNTNLSAKRRRRHVDALRKRGYEVRAVVFPIDLDTVLARQHTRKDKNVPAEAVKRQYMSLQQPMLGEFDMIVVHDTTKQV